MSLSFFAKDANGLDARRAISRENRGEDADNQQKKSDGSKRERVGGADTVNERRDDAAECERGGEAKNDADKDRFQSAREHNPNNASVGSAKRHADADFADAAANGVGQHAVNADGGENERESDADVVRMVLTDGLK